MAVSDTEQITGALAIFKPYFIFILFTSLVKITNKLLTNNLAFKKNKVAMIEAKEIISIKVLEIRCNFQDIKLKYQLLISKDCCQI